jgi:hypothetical protein
MVSQSIIQPKKLIQTGKTIFNKGISNDQKNPKIFAHISFAF